MRPRQLVFRPNRFKCIPVRELLRDLAFVILAIYMLVSAWNLRPVLQEETICVTGQISQVRQVFSFSRRHNPVAFEISGYACEADLSRNTRYFLERDFSTEDAQVLLFPTRQGYEVVQMRHGDMEFLALESYNAFRSLARGGLFFCGGFILLFFGSTLLYLPFQVDILRIVWRKPGNPRFVIKK